MEDIGYQGRGCQLGNDGNKDHSHKKTGPAGYRLMGGIPRLEQQNAQDGNKGQLETDVHQCHGGNEQNDNGGQREAVE